MAQMTEIMVYQYNCPRCGGIYHSRLPLRDKTCHLCSDLPVSYDYVVECNEDRDEKPSINRYQ